jgi:hypothetical protein
MSSRLPIVLFLAVAALSVAEPAYAYIGPGAGISLLGAVWALLLAVLTAVAMVVWYPVRRAMQRSRRRKPQAADRDASARSA